jgi:hypothetical protein
MYVSGKKAVLQYRVTLRVVPWCCVSNLLCVAESAGSIAGTDLLCTGERVG